MPSRRNASRAVVLVAVSLVGYLWAASTAPPDPLSGTPGIGWEGDSIRGVPVGQRVVVAAYLIGNDPSSRATFIGATLPRTPGLRLTVVALKWPGTDGEMFVRSWRETGGAVSPALFEPLPGSSLHAAPAFWHMARPVLTVALVEQPTRAGCYVVTGVELHYLVGASIFTKTMDGSDSISTSSRSC